MSHIVVMGAGIGGISAAYALREKLTDQDKITVVHQVDYFQFVPSNVWAGIGIRTREAITVPLKENLEKHKIEFIAQPVISIEAENNQITLQDKQTVHYDFLVITTGAKLAFDEVPGAGPAHGSTLSVCTIDHAEQTYEAYKKLIENPGPIVIGTMPGASCFGPAYEFAFIVSHDLRNRELRHKVPITFVTSEPYIGHMGLGGVNDSKLLLESELRKSNINWITNAKTEKIENGKMYVSELNDDGTVLKNHELDFNFSMMIPPFKGVDPVANVPNLCNPKGFVIVDDYQRSVAYPNIFAAGVCVAIAPIGSTPVPTGVPKTGFMIETMVSAITENIYAELNGEKPSAVATKNAVCLADMGDTGIIFVAEPQIPPRNVDWAKKGKWVHLLKVAFEKYFIYKAKNGVTEPIYEKMLMKIFDIKRLE